MRTTPALFAALSLLGAASAFGPPCAAGPGDLSFGKGDVRIAPQTDYADGERRCRVSMRVGRYVEEWAVLDVTVENLGREDLTLYNPFFHPVHDKAGLDARTAELIVFDADGRPVLDLLDREFFNRHFDHIWVAGVAQSWVVLRAGESWTGHYGVPRHRSQRRQVQAIFADRFVSLHPSGRPGWPIDADYSDRSLTREVRTYLGDLADPRVKAWRAAYTGEELFRSNAVLIEPYLPDEAGGRPPRVSRPQPAAPVEAPKPR